MSDLTSRRYQPDPEKCCEACVFGSGEHAAYCEVSAMDRLVGLMAGLVELRRLEKLAEGNGAPKPPLTGWR